MTLLTDVEALVRSVPDPELPFLSIGDLGVVRGVLAYGGTARVLITPTYSGCPALDTIREDVEKVLRDNGFDDVEVETVLSPPWTTDWLSEKGKAALAEHGIAPPGPVLVPLSGPLTCPRCGSRDTEELSRFGATACKALHRCRACREPFEHFKAH
ncbi:MAG TPA: 1,2-phenylacetyl-CoA epoxidase subunit PaaD [Mycobacteriales bacterium]|nr:1,2-phenylacetyl-CoA epoxidase subunit PaaD [Mycobacteriales bacterium]